jgi:hypothetical protein
MLENQYRIRDFLCLSCRKQLMLKLKPALIWDRLVKLYGPRIHDLFSLTVHAVKVEIKKSLRSALSLSARSVSYHWRPGRLKPSDDQNGKFVPEFDKYTFQCVAEAENKGA